MWLILLWQSVPVPPAPPLKAQTSPLANMFNHQDSNTRQPAHTPTKNSIGNIAFNVKMSVYFSLLFNMDAVISLERTILA